MATINSNGTSGGNWSATSSWAGGVVPVLGDKVNILSGDTITVDGIYRCGDDTSTALNISGILKASRTVSSEISVRGEFVLNNGGELDYGKSTDTIPSTITAKIRLNDSASLVDGKWGLTCNRLANYFVYGASKTTNTDLTTQLLATGTTFTVTDATGWAVGDTIIIATTASGSTGSQTEERVISALTGNDVTISVGTTYSHEIGARVGNMTKSVAIEAYNLSYASYQNLISNATTLTNSREIQHVALKSMGDNSNSLKYGGYRFDGSGSSQSALAYISVGNITFNTTEQYCIDAYNFYPDRLTISDCAFYTPSSTGIGTRQSAVVTFNNCVVYRAGNGVTTSWSQGGVGCIYNDCWIVGCNTGINYSGGQGFKFNNCKVASCNLASNWGFGVGAELNNCDIGYISGLYDGSCTYAFGVSVNALTNPLYNDCNFNIVTSITSNVTNANARFSATISNKNVDPSSQEIYTSTGAFFRDNTTFKTGVASLRCEPSSATIPVSNEWQIFAPTGELVVVSGYLRKDINYGSTNRPYVTLSGLGITASTYTMTDVDDTWEQFTVSGTQTTGTDGVLTLTATFQSGAANAKAWIDGIVAPPTVAVNSGNFGYWAGGAPAKLVASNFTSADDIWNKLTSDITLSGSIGKQLKDNIDIKISESGTLEI